MKKFFTYILIFVTVLQLVIPPSPAEAQSNQLGICNIYDGTTLKDAKNDITFSSCKTLANDTKYNSFRATLTAKWQDGPGGQTYTAVAPASGGGGGNTTVPRSAVTGCYNTQGQPGPQTDPATCISQGHTWHIKNGSDITSSSPTGCYNPQGQMGNQSQAQCTSPNSWYEKPGSTTGGPGGTLGDTGSAAAPGDAPKDPSADIFGSCQMKDLVGAWNVNGCVIRAFHLVFMVLPSMVLYLTAYIFNAMLALTLGTVLYKNGFLPEAWRIVRDFSNIFFILVLLYISIKMILGLGGAEVKKMIAQVIVAALLINFSMFMTQVVIDASNMLALIFYNKIQVTSQTYTPFISTKNGVQDKDIAGGIASGFNPAKFINPADVAEINNKAVTSGGLFYDLKNIAKDPSTTINPLRPLDNTTTNLKIGWAVAKSALTGGGDEKTFPPSIALAIIFTACAVYLFASYAFFIAGLAFIGRLIELWMLIIFSPFAFMSLSVPKLKGIEYLGWDAWLKRLLAVAFMAPVFMFFLLLISKLVQINIFKGMENIPGQTPITIPHVLVMLIIPAIIYISLLWKAVDYAKKGAGEFGSAIIKYGQMAAVAVGGLAVGAATGGVGMAATATLGRAGSMIAKSSTLLKMEEAGGGKGFLAARLRDVGKFAGDSSFDFRKAPGVGSMMKKMGMKTESSGFKKAIGMDTAGGFNKREEENDKRRKERVEDLKKKGNSDLKHKAHELQENLEDLKYEYEDDLTKLNTQIDNALKDAAELTRASDAVKTADPVKVEARRLAIEAAASATYTTAEEKTAAITAAQAMDVNDPAKMAEKQVAEQKAKDAVDKAEELKAQKKAIRDADFSFTVTSKSDNTLAAKYAAGDPTVTLNPTTGLYEQVKYFTDDKTSTGRQNNVDSAGNSIAKLETTLIPEALNDIKKAERAISRNIAQNLRRPQSRFMRTFNFVMGDTDQARDKTAHSLIMDAKLPDTVAK